MHQSVYSNLNFLPKHNLGTSLPKYLKSRKTVLRRFVRSNKIVHFRKPAFNWLFQATCKRTQCWELLANNVAPTMLRPFACSFKCSQMLQQNSEYRSNDVNNPWTWCTRWTKRWPTFWHESQSRQVGPHFGSNCPLYGKMPGVCLGSGRFWNWLVNNLTLVRSLLPSLA